MEFTRMYRHDAVLLGQFLKTRIFVATSLLFATSDTISPTNYRQRYDK